MTQRVLVRQSYEPSPWPRADLGIFFDVFRASTTLTALLSKQPISIVSTNDADVASRLVAGGHRLVSEVFRGGLDNSPTQVLAESLTGASVVHKSTNLTTVLFREIARVERAWIGSFVNLSALTQMIRTSGAETVELVAAGHFARRAEAVEDTACARMLAARLGGEPMEVIPDQERIELYLREKRTRNPQVAPHYWLDVELALQIDVLPIVGEAKPYLEGTVQISTLPSAGRVC